MKTIRLFLSTLLMLTVLFALTGCGGKKSKEITVDVKALADSLNSQTVTSDALTLQEEPGMLTTIYLLEADTLKAGASYMSSGATANEVAVLEFGDASQAEKAKSALEQRVKAQSDLYATYNADEVGRLDKAVIKTAGKYAVLCVCDDTEKAESLLKDAGF